MAEIGGSLEVPETKEKLPEIPDYNKIQPESNITPQESREYWNHMFRAENSDIGGSKGDRNAEKVSEQREPDKPEKTGGSYEDVYREGEGDLYEVHHMPADSVSYLERNEGPAIKMEKEDHRQTASCGNSREAREYREAQKELIEKGKFREAIQMDIDDIHEKFGDKYDDAIADMLEYVDQLEKEGKING